MSNLNPSNGGGPIQPSKPPGAEIKASVNGVSTGLRLDTEKAQAYLADNRGNYIAVEVNWR